MSPDVIARVEAFVEKAEELIDKGHLLRAAENFGRATEAAHTLGVDNLVALHMRLRHANLLLVYTTAPDAATVDQRILAAHRTKFIALLSGAVATLERRRVAGTLLEGTCTAVEVAWRAGVLLRVDPHCAAAKASLAKLVGYSEYLRAAKNALGVLARACWFSAECSVPQFQSFAEHAVHAAELMQQPRHCNAAMAVEAHFTEDMRHTVAEAGAYGLDARLVHLLAVTLQRLQRSGVLQARRVEESIAILAPAQRTFEAALHRSLTSADLRSCALPGCGAKEAHPTHFKSCAACRAVVYCCREHQVEGWPAHKKACKAARKAAAATDTEKGGAGPSGA